MFYETLWNPATFTIHHNASRYTKLWKFHSPFVLFLWEFYSKWDFQKENNNNPLSFCEGWIYTCDFYKNIWVLSYLRLNILTNFWDIIIRNLLQHWIQNKGVLMFCQKIFWPLGSAESVEILWLNAGEPDFMACTLYFGFVTCDCDCCCGE